MSEELTLEILDEMIGKLPPRSYPKRMRISYGDYCRLREACDYLGILPELKHNVSLGFGMEIVPDIDIEDKIKLVKEHEQIAGK